MLNVNLQIRMLELMVESAQQVELGGVERLVLTELTKYITLDCIKVTQGTNRKKGDPHDCSLQLQHSGV